METIINYSLGLVAFAVVIFRFKSKQRQDPSFTIGGWPIGNIIKLSYVGIVCLILLILIEFTKTKY